jgi:branched-chain amino acid transport system substrate-binding protein
MEEILRRCGNDLTRENIMRQAAGLKELRLPMLLPGISVNTSPTDYATLQEAYMVRFDGEKWLPFGDLLRGN